MKNIITLIALFISLNVKGQDIYYNTSDTSSYEISNLVILNDTFSFILISNLFRNDSTIVSQEKIKLLKSDTVWTFISSTTGRLENDTIVARIYKF